MVTVDLSGWKRVPRAELPRYWTEKLRADLTFPNPEYVGLTTHRKALMRRMIKDGTPLPPKELFFYRQDEVYLYVPRGYLTCPDESVGRDLRSEAPADWPEYWDRKEGKPPRDIQVEAINAWVLQGRPEHGVFVLPTGSGKTVFSMMLAARAGQRLLILTNRDEAGLKNFVNDAARFYGLDIGVIQGKTSTWEGRIATVATFQTLWAKQETLKKIKGYFGIVIIDEVQHCPAATFCEVVGKIAARYRFGMTATEKRGDGMEAVTSFVVGRNLFERRQAKEVAKVKVRQVRLGVLIPALQDQEVDREKREWSRKIQDANKSLKILTTSDARNWALVENMARNGAGRWNLVVTHRVRHAKVLANALAMKFGTDKVGLLVGSAKGQERRLAPVHLLEGIDDKQRVVIKRAKDGGLPWVVATYQYAAEGLDVPRFDAVHMATPTGNDIELKQVTGRARREFPGKTEALLFDYLDPNPFCERRAKARVKMYSRWEREAATERMRGLFDDQARAVPD
jgi:superfamily II DNA or RNA helicase